MSHAPDGKPASPILARRMIESPRIGAKASFARTLTEGDVALFIGVTWDVNPYHTDAVFAGQTRFRQRIVPGLLTAALLTHLGGLWAFLATEMHFEFMAPVFIGDTITASAEVVEVDPSQGKVQLYCECHNAAGVQVLSARVSGFPGQFAP